MRKTQYGNHETGVECPRSVLNGIRHGRVRHTLDRKDNVDRRINIVVIDDSAFMRKSITLMLESDPEIKVVATARDGREGIEMIRRHKPDLVTLDVEMPGMDGIEALKIIMGEMPLPVLMVSSLTTDGADATLEALDLGAVDFISKDLSHVSINIVKIRDELIAKIKGIVRSPGIRTRYRAKSPVSISSTTSLGQRLERAKLTETSASHRAVVVGISTGGPHALLRMLPQLPSTFPLGVAVVQHMPPHFTKSLAERLNGVCNLKVKEAENGDELKGGTILVAPGGKQMMFSNNSGTITTVISDEPQSNLYRPSADVMMSSAARVIQDPIVGLIMTGMGKDGLEGLRMIKNKGGYVVAQDEESCVVYGMPKAAVDEGIVDAVVPLDAIAGTLVKLTGNKGRDTR